MIRPHPAALVGRSAELAVLTAALDRARDAQGSVVLVHGEAGIGKSRLCRELAGGAEDALVLHGQAYPGDHTVAHAILVDTLRSTRRDPTSPVWAAVRGHATTLGAVLPELVAGGDTVRIEDEAQVFEAALDVVEETAAGRTAVLVAEDVQWADPASWSFLRYCGRRAPRMRLLVLVTYRDDEALPEHPGWSRLAALGDRARIAYVTLRRLDAASAEQLARAVGGAGLDDAALRDVVARSAGTPLLIEELVAARSAVRRDQASVPEVIRATVRERLRVAGEPARELVELAAVMGHDADLDLLVDLRPHLAESVEALAGAGLLHPATRAGAAVEFRHPLLREAVYDAIPWDRRRRLHAEAAAALSGHASAQPVERVARHWELAGRPELALADLREVIDVTRAAGNAMRAGTLSLLALDLVRRHDRLLPERHALRDVAVETLFTDGRWEQLRPLVEEVWHEASSLGEAERVHAAVMLALARWNLESDAEAAGRFVAAELARLRTVETPEAALLAGVGAFLSWNACDAAEASRLVALARRAAEACGSVEAELRARITGTWMLIVPGHDRTAAEAESRAIARRAHQAGLSAREASGLLQVARITLDPDDLSRALDAGAQASWFDTGSRALAAYLAAFEGRTEEACDRLDELEMRTGQGDQVAWSVGWTRAFLALFAGDTAEARLHVEWLASRWSNVVSLVPDATMLRAWLAWESGEFGTAAAGFAEVARLLGTQRIEPGFSGSYFIAPYVDSLLRGGERAAAERAVAELADAEDRPDADRFTRAAFAAARLRLSPSPAAARAAVEVAAGARWPWLAAVAELWAGELLEDRGILLRARESCRRTGYAGGAARAVRLLEAREPGTRLTPAETRVAGLIGEGLSNADIAGRLSISPVTVAHHVSSILGKLGLASRTQVAVRLARDAAGGAALDKDYTD